MIERRKAIATVASVPGTVFAGCLSWNRLVSDRNPKTTTETGQSPTTTEAEQSTTATETEQPPTTSYRNEDLIVSNWSREKRDGRVTVAPSTTDTEPFTDEFSLLPREGNPPEGFKSVYENLEQMSVDCTVTVDVNGFSKATDDWNGEKSGDYRGLRVYIEDGGIDFMENVR